MCIRDRSEPVNNIFVDDMSMTQVHQTASLDLLFNNQSKSHVCDVKYIILSNKENDSFKQ